MVVRMIMMVVRMSDDGEDDSGDCEDDSDSGVDHTYA